MDALTPFKTHHPSSYEGSPLVHSFFDDPTSTWTFVVVDPSTKDAMIIDSVLNFEPASGAISTSSVRGLVSFVEQNEYNVTRIMETHVHADHATGAFALKQLLPGSVPVYIGSKVIQVQETFAPIYGFTQEDYANSFDGYAEDGGEFKLGSINIKTCGLPGHTPDSMGILVGDSLFAGDSIFLPDVGTARVDFPGGSAQSLYTSVQRILKLAGDVKVFSGHDYPVGREKSCMSLVSDQLRDNKHLGGQATEETFRSMRETRDKQLGTPRLLHASLQINLRGGRMPPPDSEGRRFIKTPLKGDLPL